MFRNLQKTLLFLFAFFANTFIFASAEQQHNPKTIQDNKVNWQYQILDKTNTQVVLQVSAEVKSNWFLYDSISKTDDVAIVFTFNNKLPYVKKKSTLNAVWMQDDVLAGKKIQALIKKNVWLFYIKPTKSLNNIFLDINYSVFNKDNFLVEKQTLNIPIKQSEQFNLRVSDFNLQTPIYKNSTQVSLSQDEGTFSIFLLGFLGGLIALLTPCVFPLIPLTISFFGKKETTKNSGVFKSCLYGFFIVAIYSAVGIPFHLVSNFSPDFFNNLSTNVYLNSFFFLLMIVFGISFLGAFEIILPSRFTNFSDGHANKKNILGIFFMALTLCVMSFSCTGPILGTLLANTLNNGNAANKLSVGLFGFGLGIGLPFALLSLFPSMLKALPKSGKWMVQIKIFLAVIEFALAVKFISNVDLVLHLEILKREYFILIWVLLLLAYLLYILNIKALIKKEAVRFSKLKILWITFIFIFTAYLSVTLTRFGYHHHHLYKWLSNGILPPHFYSVYSQTESHINDNKIRLENLKHVNDYEEALKLSKQTGKPMLIDFTGWACVNCRKVEENIWTDLEVFRLLKNHFIITSLYVDDRLSLKEPINININGENKILSTIGEKWTYFQILNFNNNSQPLYAIMNKNEKLISTPIAYTSDVKAYKNWLLKGLEVVEKN